jgi:hypothetical protein
MQGSYHDSDWSEQVTIPVMRVGDRWEFFYGGDVPVREGALGHLTLSSSQVSDSEFLERLQKPATVKVLNEGAPLLVALSDRDQGVFLPPGTKTRMSLKLPAGTTRLVQVRLGPARNKAIQRKLDEDDESIDDGSGGLWLKVKGLDKAELLGSTIQMPDGFEEPFAISLNHALTMLSERYEKHRISHTGNVYTRVFYQESNDYWYPLADLREGVLAGAERQLMVDAWQALEKQLGWRPVAKPSKKKGKV